jgi:hypothetical protein
MVLNLGFLNLNGLENEIGLKVEKAFKKEVFKNKSYLE